MLSLGLKAYQGVASGDGIERATKTYKNRFVYFRAAIYVRGNLHHPRHFWLSYKQIARPSKKRISNYRVSSAIATKMQHKGE